MELKTSFAFCSPMPIIMPPDQKKGVHCRLPPGFLPGAAVTPASVLWEVT